MSLASCPECWEDDCVCGYKYRRWTLEYRIKKAAAVLGVGTYRQEQESAANVANPKAQAVLADIFTNSERPDKISIAVDSMNRAIVVYDDLDEEWAKELREATQPRGDA